MVGVFVSFTLSQAGMVLKWRREREPGWRRHALLNGVGAVLTGIVLVVVAMTKFTEGAWIIVALIPLLVLHFLGPSTGTTPRVAAQLSLRDYEPEPRRTTPSSSRSAACTARWCRPWSTPEPRAPTCARCTWTWTRRRPTSVRRDWERWGQGVPLVVLESPYRSLMEPLLDYIERVDAERPDDFVTILLPEFVPARWWHHLLHNQRALLIKGALLFKRNTIVTSVPFHLDA